MRLTRNKSGVLARLALALPLLGMLVPITSWAQQGVVLDEILVTATKREEGLMDVGVSVIAVGNEQLAQQGRRSLEDVGELVPNVTIERQGGANSQRVAIRGVSSPPLDDVVSSVAVFIDGVYNPNARSAFVPLYDMQRVEVLRGPQGALFGKNSIAGVLNMVTARPSFEPEAVIDLRAGTRNSHEVMLAASQGLSENVAGRVAIFDRRTGNWLDNRIGPDMGAHSTTAFRSWLTWNATSATSINLKYENFKDEMNNGTQQLISVDPNDAFFFGNVVTKLNKKTDQNTASRFGANFGRDPEQILENRTQMLALSVDHVFSNDFEFSSVYGYSDFDLRAQGDINNTPIMGVYLDSHTKFESHSLEFRISSPVERRFRYVLGGYIEDTEIDRRSGDSQLNFETFLFAVNPIAQGFGVNPASLPLPSPAAAQAFQYVAPADYLAQTDSLAVFVEGSFDFTPQWTLTGGLRFARDKFEIDRGFDVISDGTGASFFSMASFAPLISDPMDLALYTAAAQFFFSNFVGVLPNTPRDRLSRKDEVVLPSAKLEFRPNDDMLFYFSAQTGYKNGGFNSSTLFQSTEFEEETSLSFELGARLTLMGGRGRLGVAVFNTEFDDLQVAVVDSTSGAVNFTNAAEATSRGIEVDTRWQVTQQLAVGAAYGYLDAEYDRFRGAGCNIDQKAALPPGAPCSQDLSGETLGWAPEHTASLEIDYRAPLPGSLEFQSNLSLIYASEHTTELSNSRQLMADSSTLLNLRLAIHNPANDWTVALIGRNITDDGGQVQGQTASGLGTHTYAGVRRPPPVYWLQLEKRF